MNNHYKEEETKASSYRVKFARKEFRYLVKIADPKIIYHVSRMYFFAFDGFVMYTFDCTESDFQDRLIIDAIEFSNTEWAEKTGIWG
ncbi:MAG: hypothetical protein FK734_17865 [Asgard group archaeon]|nr:hypothetical protein [Asgard group archaeon]